MPAVSVVFLVYNRRAELHESLTRMLGEAAEVIVVDNASTDGSGDMVAREFPQVRLIRRERNVGVSGWNDGFAVAGGDWVLALDDDCYLPPGGLARAIEEAERHAADLVSFGVRSSVDPSHRFDQAYRTGLLAFWGCAVLMRGEVLERLGGYDPGIFVWANEVEFMVRFYDAGFRHLHLPEVVAVHMKPPAGHWTEYVTATVYRRNMRNWAYVAARHLRARDALGTLVALAAVVVRDALSVNWRTLTVLPEPFAGFAAGLRRRRPVRAPVSHAYRRNFESFASPWWVSRPPGELLRALPRDVARAVIGRTSGAAPVTGGRDYFAKRPRYYPESTATLDFR